jgi:streptogramin lyase
VCYTSRVRMRIYLIVYLALSLGRGAVDSKAEDLSILSLGKNGVLAWNGAFAPGVGLIQSASAFGQAWRPMLNVFSTNSSGSTRLNFAGPQAFYQVLTLDLSPTPSGFTNLCAAYGLLRTVAGKGEVSSDGFNGWDPQFEGGTATSAELSRPHMAMADDSGNIFIADKDGHAIRKVLPTGQIVTVAGTNVAGDNGDTPGPGTASALSSPNGIWVRGDGTIYILDLGNSKIRRLDTNGILSTLFHVNSGIDTGRGLWVAPDESLVYFASGTALRKWTPGGGVKTVENGFVELGNLVVDPAGNLVVTDRGGNRVYRVSKGGNKTAIAGNGQADGGGDGAAALDTGLLGVRGIWFVPTGGYLLATHEGSQIWYVDSAGIIHLFVDGAAGAHDGDGGYFHTPGPKISEVRAVTMDKQGRIIVTENDAGFIRTIDFLPFTPSPNAAQGMTTPR